jgi:hypothetical protein
VIREQLAELQGAVAEAKTEGNSRSRTKRLTSANAIVEGLTELAPDIDAMGAQPAPASIPKKRVSAFGGGFGGGEIGGSGSATIR